jgi:hypothetical protein
MRWVDLDRQKSEYADFVFRKQSPTLVGLFVFFLTLVLTGTAVVLLVKEPLALISILFVILGLGSSYIGNQVYHHRELQKKIEFQNALFSSALGKGYRFCLIAKKDGTIVYVNNGFSALFTHHKEGGGLEEWLTRGKVPSELRDSLFDIMERDLSATLPLTIEGLDATHYPCLLSVESIARPKGFYLLRGTVKSVE